MNFRTVTDVIVVAISYYQEYHEETELHLFSYNIHIENHSNRTFQLMERAWNITDGYHYNRNVSGEGVVGEQPILHSAESFNYTSYCPVPNDITSMKGFYIMRDVKTNELVKVNVPPMLFCTPEILN